MKTITGIPFVNHVDQNSRPTLTTDFLKDAYVRFYTIILINKKVFL